MESITKYIHMIKSQKYLYVKTYNFVNPQFYSYFAYHMAPYVPYNPIEPKSIIVPFDRYIQLIEYSVNRQHLKKPLKMYTCVQLDNVYEISGVAIGSDLLGELASLIKVLNFEDVPYTHVDRKNFYLVRKYVKDTISLELGIFNNDETCLYKVLGFRSPLQLIYFKLNYM